MDSCDSAGCAEADVVVDSCGLLVRVGMVASATSLASFVEAASAKARLMCARVDSAGLLSLRPGSDH